MLVAPERVEVITGEPATRIRVAGSFRLCPGGDCAATTHGVVELACPGASPERCWYQSVQLTRVAKARQCVMLTLDPKAIQPADATHVRATAFHAERDLVLIEANDPQCVHARRPASPSSEKGPEPIPTGYHVEERTRDGLLIAGTITTALGGLFIAVGASGQADAVFGAVVGGANLAVGVPLLLAWVALPPKRLLVRNTVSLSAAPFVASDKLGGTVTFSF